MKNVRRLETYILKNKSTRFLKCWQKISKGKEKILRKIEQPKRNTEWKNRKKTELASFPKPGWESPRKCYWAPYTRVEAKAPTAARKWAGPLMLVPLLLCLLSSCLKSLIKEYSHLFRLQQMRHYMCVTCCNLGLIFIIIYPFQKKYQLNTVSKSEPFSSLDFLRWDLWNKIPC